MLDMHTPLSQWFSIGVVTYLLTQGSLLASRTRSTALGMTSSQVGHVETQQPYGSSLAECAGTASTK
jgi:hypothetical protein